MKQDMERLAAQQQQQQQAAAGTQQQKQASSSEGGNSVKEAVDKVCAPMLMCVCISS